jgi:hypothetical protein
LFDLFITEDVFLQSRKGMLFSFVFFARHIFSGKKSITPYVPTNESKLMAVYQRRVTGIVNLGLKNSFA